jgi:hypothetical protein
MQADAALIFASLLSSTGFNPAEESVECAVGHQDVLVNPGPDEGFSSNGGSVGSTAART